MLGNNDIPFKNTIHNLSRYEFVNRISPHIYAKPHTKRLNLGGCVLKESEATFDFPLSPKEIKDLLFSYMKDLEINQETMRFFI